jgi:hypothetical protein
MVKAIFGGILLAGLITPAFAADEFWVVQDSTTKKCTIVEQKPTTTTTTVIGNTAFKTRSEAENSMKTTKVCSTK